MECINKILPETKSLEQSKYEIENCRNKLLNKVERYQEMYANGLISLREVKNKLAGISEEIKALDLEKTALSDDTLHNREQVIQLYRSEILRFLELETISNVDLRRIIDHISVNKSGIVHVELKKFDNLVMQS
jgi:cytoplasmic iron level regulating protein YaaA (DUF328/UPF0246 family)